MDEASETGTNVETTKRPESASIMRAACSAGTWVPSLETSTISRVFEAIVPDTSSCTCSAMDPREASDTSDWTVLPASVSGCNPVSCVKLLFTYSAPRGDETTTAASTV